MTDYEKHLYAIIHPNHALVASMLPPAEFGKHYTIGSSRYYHGLVIFAEIDIGYRNEYFTKLSPILAELGPKPDGSPKRTKFVSSYRVLEHLTLESFRDLHIASSLGEVLTLKSAPYDRKHEPGWMRTFQEICPLKMTVLTYMTPREFGEYITDPDSPKSAPKVFFAQIDFNTKEFLTAIREDPFHPSPVPNVHPHKLREQILQLSQNQEKRLKGISLHSTLSQESFLRLRTGFWLACGTDLLFYPLPTREELEGEHFRWYRSLTS